MWDSDRSYLLNNESEKADAADCNDQNHNNQEADRECSDGTSASSLHYRYHHRYWRSCLLSSQRSLQIIFAEWI